MNRKDGIEESARGFRTEVGGLFDAAFSGEGYVAARDRIVRRVLAEFGANLRSQMDEVAKEDGLAELVSRFRREAETAIPAKMSEIRVFGEVPEPVWRIAWKVAGEIDEILSVLAAKGVGAIVSYSRSREAAIAAKASEEMAAERARHEAVRQGIVDRAR
jgi:hypothetical protein